VLRCKSLADRNAGQRLYATRNGSYNQQQLPDSRFFCFQSAWCFFSLFLSSSLINSASAPNLDFLFLHPWVQPAVWAIRQSALHLDTSRLSAHIVQIAHS
jgi:hypothetical protein